MGIKKACTNDLGAGFQKTPTMKLAVHSSGLKRCVCRFTQSVKSVPISRT
jgi:hypothetical protein